jgi:citrate synthase
MVDQRRIDNQPWVDARAAADYLGVQQRTLYAYVSRGLVRSVPGEHGRPRLYSHEDLARLVARRDARAGHGAVAAGALRWGEPVLDSAITAITPYGPAYRGHLAVELAGRRFENVAELLWSGYLPAEPVTWPRAPLPLASLAKLIPAGAPALAVMPLLVDAAALADTGRPAGGRGREPARDDRPDAFVGRARLLIPLLAAALVPDFAAATITRALGAPSIAAIAARALSLDESAAAAIDVALVVLADHELNASSFTARVAASTGADIYACVTAALATLSGPRHGAAAEVVARFADEVGSPEHARSAVRALRKRRELPPGFGHSLYPQGDPRALPLLELARELVESRAARRARTLLAIVDALADEHPTVDVGLAALIAALGAPPSAASGLFAVARSAGWIAHALEQRAAGFMLRPRARYVGPAV